MRTSIRKFLIISLITLSISPLLVLSVIQLWQGINVQQLQAEDLQNKLSKLVRKEIKFNLREQELVLSSTIKTADLLNLNSEQLNVLLAKLFTSGGDVAHGKTFNDITLLDHNGKELASVSRTLVIKPGDLGDQSDDMTFSIPAESKEVYYSSVYFNEKTGEPLIKISLPIIDLRSNQLQGVLTATVRMKYMWDIISTIQVGKSGCAYMLDQNGRIIAHPNPSVVISGTSFDLPEKTGITRGLSGTLVVLSTEYLHLGKQLFYIVTEQPAEDALRHTINSVITFFILFLLTIACAIALVYLLIRRIVRPVESLARTAQEIGTGNYSQKSRIEGTNEIGILAGSFNTMTTRLVQTINSLQDNIAERELIEDELKVAHERLLTVLNSLDSIVYVADMQTYEFIFANQYTRDHFGDIEGKLCWQTFHKDNSGPCDYCTNAKLLDQTGNPKPPHIWEFQNTLNNRWYEGRDQAIQWSSGKYVRLEIATDITERKKAYEDLQRYRERLEKLVEERTAKLTKTNEKLRLQKELRETILNAINDPISLINTRDFCYIETNRAFEEQYGANAIGKPCYEVTCKRDTPCDPANRSCPLQESVKTKQTASSEHIHYNDTGEKQFSEVSTFPIPHRDGQISQVVHVSRDVTERKQAEDELRKAKEKAIQADRTKSLFLANMSHEIRTPMNAIIGMNRLALSTDLSPEQWQYLTTVQHSSESLLNIINDILDLSKIEAGQFALEDRSFELAEIMEATIQTCNLNAQEKGLILSHELSPQVHTSLRGDALRLRQIFLNLIGNAIKFTEEGSITLFAEEVSQNEEGVLLQFSVADTGPGIKEETQRNIFDRFTQADSSTTRHFGGTGLGLAICKELTRLFNGTLWVESTIGKGSTFYFTASFKKDQKALNISSEKTIDSVSQAATKSALKILLVEDNQFNRDLAQIVLEKEGHRVLSATTGVEALESLSEDSFDVILMDVQMPEMDGITATKLIRRCENEESVRSAEHLHLVQNVNEKIFGSQIPIIAMTAHAMSGDRDKCFEAGMDDYITKPFQPDELFKRLNQITVSQDLMDDC